MQVARGRTGGRAAEWKETRDRFDAAREYGAEKYDWATRQEWAINKELKGSGVAVKRRADVDARLNVMNMSEKARLHIEAAQGRLAEEEARAQKKDAEAERERKRRAAAGIHYADDPGQRGKIPGHTDVDALRTGFEKVAAGILLSREAAEREWKRREARERARTHCFGCGRKIVGVNETDVNETGEAVTHKVLATENDYYSGWEIVCQFCGAVYRTLTPLQYAIFIHELFASTEGAQRVRDCAADARNAREVEKERKRVISWRARMNRPAEVRARVRASKAKNGAKYRAQNADHVREKVWNSKLDELVDAELIAYFLARLREGETGTAAGDAEKESEIAAQ